MAEEKCKYCNFEVSQVAYGSTIADITIRDSATNAVIIASDLQMWAGRDGGGLLLSMSGDPRGYFYRYEDVSINFCPFCGRRLRNDIN